GRNPGMGPSRPADAFPGYDNAMTTTRKMLTTPFVDTHAAYKETCVSTHTRVSIIGWLRGCLDRAFEVCPTLITERSPKPALAHCSPLCSRRNPRSIAVSRALSTSRASSSDLVEPDGDALFCRLRFAILAGEKLPHVKEGEALKLLDPDDDKIALSIFDKAA